MQSRKKKWKEALRQKWFGEYQQLTGNIQPIPHDYWSTAQYLRGIGLSPQEAAGRFNAQRKLAQKEGEK
jgi:hypothetical protein